MNNFVVHMNGRKIVWQLTLLKLICEVKIDYNTFHWVSLIFEKEIFKREIKEDNIKNRLPCFWEKLK